MFFNLTTGGDMYKDSELTSKIICSSYNVHNTLGAGFLEKVYENALCLELKSLGLSVEQQAPVKIIYQGQIVGDYFADLLVDGKIILELKAVEALAPIHEIQLKNYLKGSQLELGLLINFGKSVEIKRKFQKNE
jgi:GxxExxY protein